MFNVFETKKRIDGSTYVILGEDAPEWLRDAVCKAHDGLLPNDWVHEECKAAYEDIASDADLDEDQMHNALHEHADGRVDIYNHERFAWATNFCNSSIFAEAEEEARELGGCDDDSIVNRLGVIQYCAIRRIATTIVDAVTEAREGGHDDEDADDAWEGVSP